MNKQKRDNLNKANLLLDRVIEIIEMVKDAEQDSFDNLPESLQDSEKGETMEETISDLDEIIDTLNEMEEQITEIIDR